MVAAQGVGHGCCHTAAMMMVPANVQARGAPECTETIEEYVDVPVRPRARRVPSKRIRVTPDKRIRVQ